MKGLSILFTLVLLVTAHLLAVQLRRARALPVQHRFHVHLAQTNSTNHLALLTPARTDTSL